MAADDHLTCGYDDPVLDALARLLRDAHRRVRALAVPEEERIRLSRRLLAICDAAKRDGQAALARAAAFLADLDRAYDTTSDRKIPQGD